MRSHYSFTTTRIFTLVPIALFFQAPVLNAWGSEHNVSQNLQLATDEGRVSPDAEMNVTVHLKMNDRAAFDAAVEQLYNPASPTYQKWMTNVELQKYAPSAASVAVVKGELEKHGLSLISIDPLGFSIRVHGTVANVESAFQTQLHQFTARDKTFQAHVQDAHLTGEADKYVESVSGLERFHVRPLYSRAHNPRTGGAPANVPLSKVTASGGLGSIETDVCFTSPTTFVYAASGVPLPTAVYFGNDYDDNTKTCAFTSSQLQAHYGLPAAYAKGLDGAGQSIVLLEAYGYPDILADANAFSTLSGLPPLNSSNFEIVYPEGKPKNPNAGVELGWDIEIAIDVQWAHTIAPGAKIIVVAAAGQDNEDFQDAISYVTTHHLANSVSDSWEVDSEQFAGPLEPESFNTVLEVAAATGISVNFSSGDGGDDGNGSPIGSPEIPADAPYATSVGGTSIFNNPNSSGYEEVGWGNNAVLLATGGTPYDPPVQIGFLGGAGGGESVFFSKPSWQAALPGSGRQGPDVAALADPYTGVAIVITSDGTQYVEAGWGGTSLACPIVTAFWSIANQNAGHALGQAARRIATLSSTEITDVLPHTSPTNVAGTIFDSTGATYYSPDGLFSGLLYDTTDFVSAVWAPVQALLSFGTDTSLTVTKGWDNVTGFGVPNGLPFITGASK